jgi:hypothetical protein
VAGAAHAERADGELSQLLVPALLRHHHQQLGHVQVRGHVLGGSAGRHDAAGHARAAAQQGLRLLRRRGRLLAHQLRVLLVLLRLLRLLLRVLERGLRLVEGLLRLAVLHALGARLHVVLRGLVLDDGDLVLLLPLGLLPLAPLEHVVAVGYTTQQVLTAARVHQRLLPQCAPVTPRADEVHGVAQHKGLFLEEPVLEVAGDEPTDHLDHLLGRDLLLLPVGRSLLHGSLVVHTVRLGRWGSEVLFSHLLGADIPRGRQQPTKNVHVRANPRLVVHHRHNGRTIANDPTSTVAPPHTRALSTR